MQHTVRSPVTINGVGLHSGKPVSMTLWPAKAGTGIRFNRSDIGDRASVEAIWHKVEISPLCTKLVGDDGISVSTIEHLMAALHALGVDNCLVAINGPEVPIMDGSAEPFIRAVNRVGLAKQSMPRKVLEILKTISVSHGGAWARIEPAKNFQIMFTIDFPEPSIGRQAFAMALQGDNFARGIADCRTFCREADILAMRNAGLALGGTLDNAVVFNERGALNPGGLRRQGEPVRHKVLDAIGDLYLSGGQMRARYSSFKGGHALTNTLLRAIFADQDAFRLRSEEVVVA